MERQTESKLLEPEPEPSKRPSSPARARQHCDRCLELELPTLISKWSWTPKTSVTDPRVLQRVLFDLDLNHPPVETCRTCRRIERYVSYQRVQFIPTKSLWTHFESDAALDIPGGISLRSWGCPTSTIQGTRTHFGLPVSSTFPLRRLSHEKWNVDHVNEVGLQPVYGTIQNWMRQCSDTHERCRPQRYMQLQDLRVVDVQLRCLTILPEDQEYLALSYVWGSFQQPVVPRTGPLPDNLGLTIENAMTVVRKLGYKYLWVDSICIDQSNMNEMRQQISHMHWIYHGAFATIVVLDSVDANSGIPGVGPKRNKTRQIWAQFGNNSTLSRCPLLSTELKQSVWATRAWTYQEALLSHKRIVFTRNQVHFLCNEYVWSEDVLYGEALPGGWQAYQSLLNPMDFTSINLRRVDPFIPFEDLINGYVSRKMTKPGDALSAVSGLLGQMEGFLFPKGFCFGLPIKDFRRSLLWTQHQGDDAWGETCRLIPAKQRLDVGLPSWSWVGWELSQSVSFHRLEITEDDNYLPPLAIWHHDLQLCVDYPQCHFNSFPRLLNLYSNLFVLGIHYRDGMYGSRENPLPDLTDIRSHTIYRRHAEIERAIIAARISLRNSESVASTLCEGAALYPQALRISGLTFKLETSYNTYRERPFQFEYSKPDLDSDFDHHVSLHMLNPGDFWFDLVPFTNHNVYASSSRLHDLEYLWVSAKILEKPVEYGTPSFEMDINFLVLRRKEDGVAERAGVARLSLYGDQFKTLLRECKPVWKTFWVV